MTLIFPRSARFVLVVFEEGDLGNGSFGNRTGTGVKHITISLSRWILTEPVITGSTGENN